MHAGWSASEAAVKMQSWAEDIAPSGQHSFEGVGANALVLQGDALKLPGKLAMRYREGDATCFNVSYYLDHNKVRVYVAVAHAGMHMRAVDSLTDACNCQSSGHVHLKISMQKA